MALILSGSGTISGISVGGLPDAIITQPELATGVGGTGPAFSANQGTAQSLAASTYTKLVFGNEIFDTNSNYDNSTYRFTPTVAGYYQISAASYINSTGTKLIALYKNGVNLFELGRNASNTDTTVSGSVVVYANGSTDYFEIYGLSTVLASAGASSAPEIKWFAGVMVRGA